MHRRWLLAALMICVLDAGQSGCAHRPKRWVSHLELRGNQALSTREIKRGLATRQTGWWPFATHWEYRPDELETDRRRIERLYAEHGFFEAGVAAPEVSVGKNGAVDITLQIEEGAPTQVRRLELEGLPALEAKALERLRRKLDIQTGERFDYEKWEEAKSALSSFLRAHGYGYSEVAGEVRVARSSREADLVLRARPGPLVHLQGMSITGAGAIPTGPIHLQQPWVRGQLYRPEDLTLLSRRLNAMGVFATVAVDLPQPPRPNPDVAVRLTTGRLRRLRLGGGIGLESRRNDLRLTGEWSSQNFLGGLRVARLTLQPAWVFIPAFWNLEQSGPAVVSEAELRQPYWFGTRFSASARVGYDLDVEEGYRYHGPRGRMLVERVVWRDLLRLGASYNLQYLMFFNINPAVFNPLLTPLGLGFRTNYRLAWLEQSVILDWRDQPLDTRRGVYLETWFEEGLVEIGGNFNYLKITPDLRGYLPIGGRLSLAGRAVLGWLHPFGDEESPVTRRYLFGGPTSHRGFSYGRLSPQTIDPATGQRIPVGGNGAVLFSVEARLRALQLFGYWLDLVPFFDAGDVVARFQDLDLSALHLAVGGSLAYETPVGALTVGIGVRLNRLGLIGPRGAPNPDPGSRIAFHITLGTAF